MNNPEKPDNTVYTRRRKTKQKQNTICSEHHYTQTNTNNTSVILQTTGDKHTFGKLIIKILNPFNRFSTATFVYLSQVRTWISNVLCRGFFFMFSEWKWNVIVRFSDIGVMFDHYCLNFLFIIKSGLGWTNGSVHLLLYFKTNTIDGGFAIQIFSGISDLRRFWLSCYTDIGNISGVS